MSQEVAKLVPLPTLDELTMFWAQQKPSMPYAARFPKAAHVSAPYVWVFGSSKHAVINMALQWSRWKTNCTWRPADEEERTLAKVDSSCDFGFWEFTNLPFGIPFHNWFDEPFDLTDSGLRTDEVLRIFKEKTFDAWNLGSSFLVVFMNSEEIDEEVRYWQEMRAAGEDYYGSENEPNLLQSF